LQNVSEQITVISKRFAKDFHNYGSHVVSDLDLLSNLRKSKEFIKENKRLWEFYAQLNHIANEIEKRSGPDAVFDALNHFYDDIRKFINRWKTVPLPPCIFQLEVRNPAGAKRYFEQVFTDLGACRSLIGKVFQWTSQDEMLSEFRQTKKYVGRWDLDFSRIGMYQCIYFLRMMGGHTYSRIADWIQELLEEESPDDPKIVTEEDVKKYHYKWRARIKQSLDLRKGGIENQISIH
jgi:hypothetical protein